MSGQQLVEHHSQRVNIRERGDGLSLNLLRARILGIHQPHHRDRGRQLSRGCRIEKLRNSEVEQLDRSIGRNQDVAGLQIAMYHQALVRVVNRGADAAEQFEALAAIQLALVAPLPKLRAKGLLEKVPRSRRYQMV